MLQVFRCDCVIVDDIECSNDFAASFDMILLELFLTLVVTQQ